MEREGEREGEREREREREREDAPYNILFHFDTEESPIQNLGQLVFGESIR